MGHLLVSFALLTFLTVCFIPLSEQQGENLKISVYYETYCPDSINFIMNQLAPMMGEFNKYPDWLILDLIPFGFAKETGHFKWTCQHGPKECAGNKLNACIINELVTTQYTPFYMRLVNFIYCTMAADNQIKAARQCAAQTGVNYKKLMKCYKGKQGNELVEMYGNRTASLQPPLNWVPTAVFNDKYNETENNEAQNNLYGVVCSYMPDECK